jgi:hypothetical protein
MSSKKIVRSSAVLTACCLLAAVAPALQAQDNGVSGPPKILVVQREFTKPGKGGTLHERSEGAFVAASRTGKAPFHYLAMTSMSGPDRALFLSGYSSLAAWEAENKLVGGSLAAALDRAMVSDGDLLASTDSSVWLRRDDLSLNNGGLDGARYMEISQYMVKPGHGHEWDELVKMYVAGYAKVPGMHWTTFQQVYGVNSDAYIAVTPLKSLSEADAEWGSDKAFSDAVGEAGMKKIAALSASCLDSEQTNLFHFSPRMSIPPPEWIKAEPDYWAPKAAMPAPAKKAEAKPAQ